MAQNLIKTLVYAAPLSYTGMARLPLLTVGICIRACMPSKHVPQSARQPSPLGSEAIRVSAIGGGFNRSAQHLLIWRDEEVGHGEGIAGLVWRQASRSDRLPVALGEPRQQ